MFYAAIVFYSQPAVDCVGLVFMLTGTYYLIQHSLPRNRIKKAYTTSSSKKHDSAQSASGKSPTDAKGDPTVRMFVPGPLFSLRVKKSWEKPEGKQRKSSASGERKSSASGERASTVMNFPRTVQNSPAADIVVVENANGNLNIDV